MWKQVILVQSQFKLNVVPLASTTSRLQNSGENRSSRRFFSPPCLFGRSLGFYTSLVLGAEY